MHTLTEEPCDALFASSILLWSIFLSLKQ
uniref:Uncharacterized protein n=1 Tax=Anguilla anguilla TaxID=7936 RepID=A0A0E9Q292_ANGAN